MNQMEIADEYWQQLDRILVGDPYVGRVVSQNKIHAIQQRVSLMDIM